MQDGTAHPIRLTATLVLLLAVDCGANDEPLPGRVLLSDGSPARSAKLQLIDREGLTIASTTTDARGHYAFEDILSGEYRVHARLDHRGTARSEVLSDGMLPGLLTLRGSAQLAGQLRDRSGNPLPGQPVMALSADLLASDVMPMLDRYIDTNWHPTLVAHHVERNDGLACSQIRTDAQGRFRFTGLRPGPFVIAGACFLDRRVSDPQQYLLPEGTDDAELSAELCRLDVELVSAQGKPYLSSSHKVVEGIGRVSCFATQRTEDGSSAVLTDHRQRSPAFGGKTRFWIPSGDHFVAVTLPTARHDAHDIIDRRVVGVMVSIGDEDALQTVRLVVPSPRPMGRLSIGAGEQAVGELFIADEITGIPLHALGASLPVGQPIELPAGRYLVGAAVVEVFAGRDTRVSFAAAASGER
jgi:hypothetical protein